MDWREEAKGKRVFIGLSGGVDSAVAAALLKREGARGTGVFIKGWYPPGLPCTWAAERRDAMRVAAALAIPFETLDASKEYKRGVIDYLLAEYRAGRTPNPDVMCNKEVKFGAFWRYAAARGADYIATGHYARRQEERLLRGADQGKDQSYFLWAVPQAALVKTLFPLGELRKEEVRALAKRFDLPVAQKRESQGICFLGDVSVKDFLRTEALDNPAVLHTLGERVAGGYVVGKDVAAGTIEIGPAPPGGAGPTVRFLREHWLLPAARARALLAQYRYHGPRVGGRVADGVFTADASLAELPVPGQSIVFYDDGALAGGGILSP